jgi:molecular chaperone HscB
MVASGRSGVNRASYDGRMSEAQREDAFDALGIEPRFDLDEGELRAAWLKRSLEAHPDRAGDASREISARLNDAKRVLEDPERRASALLARLGGPSKEEEKGLPDGFLMEIMQLREELEAAQAIGDGAAIAESRRRAEREREARMRRVAELFSSGKTDADTLRAVRVELNAWRYLERMIEQAEPVERS